MNIQQVQNHGMNNALNQSCSCRILNCHQVSDRELTEQHLKNIPIGFIGPDLNDSFLEESKSWRKYFVRLIDLTALNLDNFICGANKIDEHIFNCTWQDLKMK